MSKLVNRLSSPAIFSLANCSKAFPAHIKFCLSVWFKLNNDSILTCLCGFIENIHCWYSLTRCVMNEWRWLVCAFRCDLITLSHQVVFTYLRGDFSSACHPLWCAAFILGLCLLPTWPCSTVPSVHLNILLSASAIPVSFILCMVCPFLYVPGLAHSACLQGI